MSQILMVEIEKIYSSITFCVCNTINQPSLRFELNSNIKRLDKTIQKRKFELRIKLPHIQIKDVNEWMLLDKKDNDIKGKKQSDVLHNTSHDKILEKP